ncbi:TetR/AcrR family transcriptional regulator [Paenibacillus sp. LjRoot56]|uniref:TetR/AcrR family transcriptional regulator n=1 Tax=Paenibacillus sp. LjRoot56 TaxID=3342333 RepID=UPI003ECF3B05
MIFVLREVRKQELKQQLFLKAIELFQEKGYDNVTVEEIASSCGVAKGTFFNYFPKKEHILLHLGQSQIQFMSEIVQKHQIPNLRERLRLIFNDLLSTYVQHSELLKLTLSETMKSALLMKEESPNILIFQQTLCQIINEAKDLHAFQTRWESSIIASVLVGIYFNSLLSWAMIQSQGEDLTVMFNKQMDVIWEGIEQ